ISTAPGGFPSSNTLFVLHSTRLLPDVESRVLEQRNSARSDLDRAVGHGPLPSPKETRHKGRESWLSSHSSSFLFTGTFRYDSPSLGIVRKISCPGVASRASLVAPLLAPRAAKARPVAPCVPEQRPAPLNKSCRLAGALRDPLL